MKSTRFYFGRAALILSAILFVFAFAGCKTDDDENTLPAGIEELSSSDKLIGEWKETYGTYKITQTTFTNLYNDSETYSGDNLVVGRLSSDSGYIYIKYTRAYESTTTEPTTDVDSWTSSEYNGTKSWYRYSTTAPDVGKWHAISYKNLIDSSVQLSGAYGSAEGHYKTSTDTLEEAISEFTIDNGYFSDYSDCTK